MYYLLLAFGLLFAIAAPGGFIYMYMTRKFKFLRSIQLIGIFLLGILLLTMTLPSLKYMVLKQYDVVEGECRIEISTSGRSADATLHMVDADEYFSFPDVPGLDAYGLDIPYYCEVTVSKDHVFEIQYKIFDVKTGNLLVSNE
ncbi:hypothetical protein [Planococcus halotolerans]|uniref:hypothetical protein n=1 Tax=Planococcus halotolerans TaxID=2233542 RepID=UPI001092B93D|nr:hypothetical protein [Planococcus halotolerans]QHJ69935.1 hypothetical protein DNR44_004670 [Planococcus halotolerans]